MNPHPKPPPPLPKTNGCVFSFTLKHFFILQNCFCLHLCQHFHTYTPYMSVYGWILARICLVTVTLRHVCCVYYVQGVTLSTCTARSCPAHRQTEASWLCRESAICSDLCKTVNPGLGWLPLAPTSPRTQ